MAFVRRTAYNLFSHIYNHFNSIYVIHKIQKIDKKIPLPFPEIQLPNGKSNLIFIKSLETTLFQSHFVLVNEHLQVKPAEKTRTMFFFFSILQLYKFICEKSREIFFKFRLHKAIELHIAFQCYQDQFGGNCLSLVWSRRL